MGDYKGNDNRLNDTEKYDLVVSRLKERGVSLTEIAELTMYLQQKYISDLKLETCLDHVERVVMKREVQNAILTGLELDTGLL
jgi:phosphatidylglycerophosphatase A